MSAALSPRMEDALRRAAARFDGAITECDRRTWAALYRRELVRVHTGKGTDRRGGTVYGVVVGVYITDAGRAVVA
jgi:hypothetical protein